MRVPPRRVLKLSSVCQPAIRVSRVDLTLLGRQGCHLCEDAAAVLHALADELDVNLHRTDIDTDPALRTAFNEHVPVLLHGDHEICRHALDLPVLERYLASLPPATC